MLSPEDADGRAPGKEGAPGIVGVGGEVRRLPLRGAGELDIAVWPVSKAAGDIVGELLFAPGPKGSPPPIGLQGRLSGGKDGAALERALALSPLPPKAPAGQALVRYRS